LWRAAHQKVLLDDVWLSDLLSHVQAAPVSPDVETAAAMAARDLRADVPPLRLAGERALDEPPLTLPTFLSAAPPPPGPPAPFVAREQELAALAAALTTARSGAGQIMFVIGEAGRGKTMLVQEFVRQAQAADPKLLVVSGACNAHTGSHATGKRSRAPEVQPEDWPGINRLDGEAKMLCRRSVDRPPSKSAAAVGEHRSMPARKAAPGCARQLSQAQ